MTQPDANPTGAIKADQERQPLSREAIMVAALEIVEERGLKALTMRGLGERLGVKAMALYHYFASKDELLEAVVTMTDTAATQFAKYFDDLSASGATPREICVAVGLRYIAFAERHPDKFHLMFGTLPMPYATWEEFVSAKTNFTIPQSAVQAGIDAKVFVEREGYGRDEMAFHLWALVHGLAVLRTTRLRALDADFESLNRTLLESLVDGFEGSAESRGEPAAAKKVRGHLP